MPEEQPRPIDPQIVLANAVEKIDDGLEGKNYGGIVDGLLMVFGEPGIAGAAKRGTYGLVNERMTQEPELSANLFDVLQTRLKLARQQNIPERLKGVIGVAVSIDFPADQLQQLIFEAQPVVTPAVETPVPSPEGLKAEGWTNPQETEAMRRRIEFLEAQRDQSEAQVTELSDESAGKDKTINDQKSEITKLRSTLEETTRVSQEAVRAAHSENIDLITKQRELGKQITELKDQLTEAQREGASQGIKVIELSQRVEDLEQQLKASQPANPIPVDEATEKTSGDPNKPVKAELTTITEPDGRLIRQFQAYCDEQFRLAAQRQNGREQTKGADTEKGGLSHSRIETQTTFLDRNQSDFNPRYGMYRIINVLFGKAASFVGDPAEVGEDFIGEVTPERAQQIGSAIELLSREEGATRNSIFGLIRGLSAARQYYDYGDRSETFFIGSLPERVTKGFKKDKFFMNIPNVIDSITAISSALHGVPGLDQNPLTSQLAHSFQTLENSELVKELKQLTQSHPEMALADNKTNLEALEIEGKKVSDVIIEIFQRNQADCNLLTSAGQSIAVLAPFAEYYRQMNSIVRPETPRVAPEGDRLVLEDARNPYAILLSALSGGRSLASEDSNWYRYGDPLAENFSWPPSVEFTANLAAAIGNEIPVSISIDPARPIILLTGNNGGGKTRFMETMAQTAAHAIVTGTNNTARVLHLSALREIRSLVGASRHTTELSSFQREALLLTDAVNTLITTKTEGERAVLVVDEVGKGTDSRDAIALMIAVTELCRRNNIYLLMATHHGQEFVNLATRLGMRDSMVIYSPDFQTHQLIEYSAPESSKGIEVMSTRARIQRGGIPIPVINGLTENARRVRTAVLENSTPHLDEIKIEGSDNSSFIFADQATLADIGLNFEKRSFDDNSDYATAPLRDRVKSLAGINGWTLRAMWDEAFFNRYREVANLDRTSLDTEHNLIKAFVGFVQRSPDGIPTLIRQSGTAFNTARILGNQLSGDKLRQTEDSYQRYLQGDLARGLSFGDREKQVISEFIETIADTNMRTRTFDSLKELGQSMQTSPDQALARLGARVLSFIKNKDVLEEIMTRADIAAQEQFGQYLRVQAAKGIRSGLSGYSYKLSEEDAASLATYLGEKITPNYFETVAQRIERGDQEAYTKFSRWLIGTRQPNPRSSYSTSALDILYRSTKIEYLVKTSEELAKYQERQRAATDRYTASPLQEAILKDLLSANISHLFPTVRNTSRPNSGVYFDYNTTGEIIRIINGLDTGKYFAWTRYLAEQKTAEETPPPTTDLYAILGVGAGANEAEIRQAMRRIVLANHPDRVTPVEWNGGNKLESAPEEVKRMVADAAKRSDQALEASQVLLDPVKRKAYDQSSSIRALSDMVYYSTMVNAIVDLKWSEAQHSDDGSFDLKDSLALSLIAHWEAGGRYKRAEILNRKNEPIIPQSFNIASDTESVVIGGSNGNGKSQFLIQLASAFIWDKMTGYVPAQSATLPKANFVACMINSGESVEGKSSFQNEIDRYIDFLDRYIKAGSPTDGYIFLDEPLAGTSSEDQIGILLSMIEFFKQRRVRVVFTNHNYRTYEFMRRSEGADGSHIKFKPVAFMAGQGKERFQLGQFDPNNTDNIRSDGIAVAGELGMPEELINIGYFARNALTGTTQI